MGPRKKQMIYSNEILDFFFSKHYLCHYWYVYKPTRLDEITKGADVDKERQHPRTEH